MLLQYAITTTYSSTDTVPITETMQKNNTSGIVGVCWHEQEKRWRVRISIGKKEKINFLFTSQMGYGYHGDDKKIGTNQPLFCTVSLHNFISEAAFKKEIQLRKSDALNQVPIEASVKQTKTVNTIKDTLTH